MRLSGDELKAAFRMRVAEAPNKGRRGCPTVDELGATMLPETDEAARLQVIDHLGECLPCAREFQAARLLHAGHESIAPMLPERLEAVAGAEGEVVPFPARHADAPHRGLTRPAFALAAAAGLAVVFFAGVLFSHLVTSKGGALVAVAPAGRAASADLELAWQPLASAARYDVTMSWPTGAVFYGSGPVAATRIAVPADAVAKMKRGQTCLWTLRAFDAGGRELARETFSFVVDFDPPRS